MTISSCGKEQLDFNPSVTADSSIDDLISTQSFFSRSDKTFIISQEEYQEHMISREDSIITFTNADIFTELSSYDYIAYPYFTDTPENYFMGSIDMIEENNGEIKIHLGPTTYDDLYDDYLINTALPNGLITLRNDCEGIGKDYKAAKIVLNTQLSTLSGEINDALKSDGGSDFFDDFEVGLQLVGDMDGCVTYFNTPSRYGITIDDFTMTDVGFDLSFSKSDTNLESLLESLSNGDLTALNDFIENLSDIINTAAGLSQSELENFKVPLLGVYLNVLFGYNLEQKGEFILDHNYKVSTNAPLKIELSLLKNELVSTVKINDRIDPDIRDYVNTVSNTFMGANAEVSLEGLFGLSFSDLGNTLEIGTLLGQKKTIGLEGQVGTKYINDNNSENYIQGCGSYKITDHWYLYGSLSYFDELDYLPNTLQIGEWPVYDIASDPIYSGNDGTINYNKICFPDNCVNILTGESYVKIDSIKGNTIHYNYLINNAITTAGAFEIVINFGSHEETIVANGFYGAGISGNYTFNSDEILNAISLRDQSNLELLIHDIDNDCTKTLPEILYSIECNPEVFTDFNTGLSLRAYNLDIDGDALGGSCYSSDDPVWVFQNETLAALYGYNPGYQSFDYMTKENCQCYASELSDPDGQSYSIPTANDMLSFISATQNLNYSMYDGNNFCSNFSDTGYIILSGAICNNTWSSNPIQGVTTDYCINNFDKAYFHVDNPSDPLNDYLFELDKDGFSKLEPVAKGVLAPCRLKLN